MKPRDPGEGPSAAGRDDHEPAALHGIDVPGASASTVDASSWWNSSLRHALRGGSKFAIFLKTLLKTATTSSAEEATGKPWPMPIPYPTVWLREAGGRELLEDFSFKHAVNMMVASLNWLFLRRPPVAPHTIRLGTKLSRIQWRVVRELERLSFSWNGKIVTAVDMGRTASKIEALERAVAYLIGLDTEGGLLSCLSNPSGTPAPGRGYSSTSSSLQDLRPGLRRAFGGHVIGSVKAVGGSPCSKAHCG